MAVNRSRRKGRPAARGRVAQRRRTRKAIVDAAIALLAGGAAPSVAEVAAAADVSRRTVYMYFPTVDQLLIDATVGALSQQSVDHQINAPGPDDVEHRVERMVRALARVSPEIERLGRTLIRLTVESDAARASGDGVPRRGFRRVEWIESALAPLRSTLVPARFRRLVSALAMVVGWEALVVQRDVCGLDAEEGEAVSLWAAHALLRATLHERRTRTAPGTAKRTTAGRPRR